MKSHVLVESHAVPFSVERLRKRIDSESASGNHYSLPLGECILGISRIAPHFGRDVRSAIQAFPIPDKNNVLSPRFGKFRTALDELGPYAEMPTDWAEKLDPVGLRIMMAMNEARLLLACRQCWEKGGRLPRDVVHFVSELMAIPRKEINWAVVHGTLHEQRQKEPSGLAKILLEFQSVDFDLKYIFGSRENSLPSTAPIGAHRRRLYIPLRGDHWWNYATLLNWSMLFSLVDSDAKKVDCVRALCERVNFRQSSAYAAIDSLCEQGLLEFVTRDEFCEVVSKVKLAKESLKAAREGIATPGEIAKKEKDLVVLVERARVRHRLLFHPGSHAKMERTEFRF